jgi:hypothetical protein
MDENKIITAHFTQDHYTLNTNTIGNGNININPQQDYYLYGDQITLTANAEPGWTFSHWNGSIDEINESINIFMDDDKIINAYFTSIPYVLNITISGKGTVDKNPNLENYIYGTIVELKATPGSGWTFDHWSGNLTGNENPALINITSNNNITAHFIKKKYEGGGGGYPAPTPPNSDPNIPPVAIAGGPYYGNISEDILFNASLSYDPDQYIKSWIWEFGDGLTDTGEMVYHNYSLEGVYFINLTVIDAEDASDTNITFAVIIKPNSPPSIPEIDGPIEGIVDVEYNFSFVSNDDADDEIKYIINWNDSNISESEFIPAGQLYIVSHSWSESGKYIIQVIADDNESISIEDFEITIRDPEKPDIPEEYNIFWLILLLIALLFLLILYILAKKFRKKEEEEDTEKNT